MTLGVRFLEDQISFYSIHTFSIQIMFFHKCVKLLTFKSTYLQWIHQPGIMLVHFSQPVKISIPYIIFDLMQEVFQLSLLSKIIHFLTIEIMAIVLFILRFITHRLDLLHLILNPFILCIKWIWLSLSLSLGLHHRHVR